VPPEADDIVVHDAAHPMATPALVRALLSRLRDGFDAVAPIKPLTDPLKRVADGRIVDTVPRENVWTTQSPAAFRAETLRAVYRNGEDSAEDLILVEKYGGTIGTIPGEAWNIHVTTSKDLEVVSLLMEARRSLQSKER
jgi:2-C-methyl-D-erythritol 4-phosphate cytidylyltransferase